LDEIIWLEFVNYLIGFVKLYVKVWAFVGKRCKSNFEVNTGGIEIFA